MNFEPLGKGEVKETKIWIFGFFKSLFRFFLLFRVAELIGLLIFGASCFPKKCEYNHRKCRNSNLVDITYISASFFWQFLGGCFFCDGLDLFTVSIYPS